MSERIFFLFAIACFRYECVQSFQRQTNAYVQEHGSDLVSHFLVVRKLTIEYIEAHFVHMANTNHPALLSFLFQFNQLMSNDPAMEMRAFVLTFGTLHMEMKEAEIESWFHLHISHLVQHSTHLLRCFEKGKQRYVHFEKTLVSSSQNESENIAKKALSGSYTRHEQQKHKHIHSSIADVLFFCLLIGVMWFIYFRKR